MRAQQIYNMKKKFVASHFRFSWNSDTIAL